MKIYKVKVNGKVYEVELESVSENDNKIALSKENNQVSSNTSSDKVVVASPMQGTILSVNVSLNQKVSKGQVLLILEAMKLENEIVSPVDGIVKEIKVSKGTSVNSKQELLIIE
ncbi:MAG: biotin/lipoyl-binding protein [Erysipelotrichaceae bacterium]|nr:biotin/lipoyl-binding protein [Erysipelotrichaceae bacterium]